MKISLNWLAEYVELPASADTLAGALTMAGLEVEGVERLGEGLAGVVVAQILEKSAHPNAEKLSIARVDAGEKGTLQIVCGAKNYGVGDKVPLATVGARLPSGQAIEAAKLRGVESFGMLCSSRELALSEDASGLLILEPSLKVGAPVADALGLKDVVFEVNVTPNRGDCLSHLGIAREVAALTGKPLRMPPAELDERGERADALIRVTVEDVERCPHYAARVLERVTLGPSPMWMQNRLRAVGVRALSNAVDVTNYVLMECGQPLHAFDLDLVRGAHIIVRRARPGEKMTTLDGKERALSTEDLCICDETAPSALAGVMGGVTSEVHAKTRRLLLESAFFAPGPIRRTSRRHALHTEASHRFERGVDPQGVLFAQDRATRLLAELCGATVAVGRVDAAGPERKPRTFALRTARVGELLGAPIAPQTTQAVLTRLGFKLEGGPDTVTVEVPSWRSDVEGPADCVEEVARTLGYHTVPAALPRGAAELPAEPKGAAVEARARSALAAAGLDEVLNYSFVAAKALEVLTPGQPALALKNPLSVDQAVMCTTRIAGLLENLKYSRNRQVEDVRLYELGRVYRPPSDPGARQPAEEHQVLAGVLFGHRASLQWGTPREPVDFYDLKGAVEEVLEGAGIFEASFVPLEGAAMLHPRSACEVRVGERRLGQMGELHPIAAQALGLPRDPSVFVFELDFEALVAAANPLRPYRGLPRFPAVLRDLAVVLDDQVSAAAVLATIREAGGGLVEDAVLFDVYHGLNIPPGKKSLAFAIRYRASERTLTDEESGKAHAQVVERLVSRFGAELRA
jgi:phenylalanyl-tRNA synthetase beta chain